MPAKKRPRQDDLLGDPASRQILTPHVEGLLKSSYDRFGLHLTKFLLTGLGEEVKGPRWHFVISYTSGGEGYLRRVRAITHEPEDGPAMLPRRCDPLVLLALLRMLTEGEPEGSYSLSYELAQVLEQLGWADTDGARAEIGEAVRRYSMLKLESEMSRKELGREGLAFNKEGCSIISEYYARDEEQEGRREARVLYRVTFSPNFVEGLKRRSLFGIDWDNVRRVTRARKMR